MTTTVPVVIKVAGETKDAQLSFIDLTNAIKKTEVATENTAKSAQDAAVSQEKMAESSQTLAEKLNAVSIRLREENSAGAAVRNMMTQLTKEREEHAAKAKTIEDKHIADIRDATNQVLAEQDRLLAETKAKLAEEQKIQRQARKDKNDAERIASLERIEILKMEAAQIKAFSAEERRLARDSERFERNRMAMERRESKERERLARSELRMKQQIEAQERTTNAVRTLAANNFAQHANRVGEYTRRSE